MSHRGLRAHDGSFLPDESLTLAALLAAIRLPHPLGRFSLGLPPCSRITGPRLLAATRHPLSHCSPCLPAHTSRPPSARSYTPTSQPCAVNPQYISLAPIVVPPDSVVVGIALTMWQVQLGAGCGGQGGNGTGRQGALGRGDWGSGGGQLGQVQLDAGHGTAGLVTGGRRQVQLVLAQGGRGRYSWAGRRAHTAGVGTAGCLPRSVYYCLWLHLKEGQVQLGVT